MLMIITSVFKRLSCSIMTHTINRIKYNIPLNIQVIKISCQVNELKMHHAVRGFYVLN